LPLQHVLLAAAAVAIALYLWHYRPSSLEARIALRYIRSRRSSRLLSLITVIAVGGVTVGVMALVVVLGVMNGLQEDLRDKILVANPHLRVLTYGEGLRLDDWRRVLDGVRRTPGVEAAARTSRSSTATKSPASSTPGCTSTTTATSRSTAAWHSGSRGSTAR